jgi:hypothetical protein
MQETMFVSYSRADRDFALRLAEDLRAAGFNVWMDQADIRPGETWDEAIEHALMTSSSLLLILSPNSIASQSVMNELSFALDENKRVLPVLYRSCKIPLRIRRLHYIDFTSSYQAGLRALTSGYERVSSRENHPPSASSNAKNVAQPFGDHRTSSVRDSDQSNQEATGLHSPSADPRLVGARRMALAGCTTAAVAVAIRGGPPFTQDFVATAIIFLLWMGGVSAIAGWIAGVRRLPTILAFASSLLIFAVELARGFGDGVVLFPPLAAIAGAVVGRVVLRNAPGKRGPPNAA